MFKEVYEMIRNRNTVWNTAGNASRNEDQYIQLPKVATASLPDDGAATMEGTISYDSTQRKLVVYTNGAWETVTSSA